MRGEEDNENLQEEQKLSPVRFSWRRRIRLTCFGSGYVELCRFCLDRYLMWLLWNLLESSICISQRTIEIWHKIFGRSNFASLILSHILVGFCSFYIRQLAWHDDIAGFLVVQETEEEDIEDDLRSLGDQKNHDSWDFALINQQPFSLMWYFMIFHNWTWEKNPYPKILSQMSPPKMFWQSTTQDWQTTFFFVSSFCVRRLVQRWRWFAANMGGSSKRRGPMPCLWLLVKKTWNHKVWMMIKMLIGKYMNMEYHGISYRLYRNMMIV